MEALTLTFDPMLLLAVALWVIPWKAWALWLAARRGDLKWFLVLVIVNTLGILEMIYIFIVAKQSDQPDASQES
jgi:methionyl-tRNA synthetase